MTQTLISNLDLFKLPSLPKYV